LEAARLGPDIRSARVALPKGLKRGKRAPTVRVDGRKKKAGRARRSVKPKLGDGARRVKIVWKRLRRTKRKLKRTAVVPVTMVDERGKRTALKVRVPRG
jgi:hypothetical protein